MDIQKYYKSFSGVDAMAFLLFPDSSPIVLGPMTTISYSIFRQKNPIALMNKINVAGFTKGTRIVAGTMIFTMINKHWVNEVIQALPWLKEYGKIKADELPTFDIMVICANEYGASASLMLHGVTIVDEGQVLSIEDMFTENQFSFACRDIDVMDSNGDNNITIGKGTTKFKQPLTGVGNVGIGTGGVQPVKPNSINYDVKVVLNGQTIATPDAKPLLYEGRLMVPFRAIFESLSYEVTHTEGPLTTWARKPGKSDSISVSMEGKAVINGKSFTMSVTPIIEKSRMMVPAKIIFEELGYKVEWDDATRTVYITDPSLANKPTLSK